MTKDELIAEIVRRKIDRTQLPWGAIVSTLSSAPADFRSKLLAAIESGDATYAGKLLLALFEAQKRTDITADAAQKLAGANIKVDDLLELLD